MLQELIILNQTFKIVFLIITFNLDKVNGLTIPRKNIVSRKKKFKDVQIKKKEVFWKFKFSKTRVVEK